MRTLYQGGRFAGALSPRTRQQLERMAAEEPTRFFAPFPAAVVRALAAELWEWIEPFINGPRPEQGRHMPEFDIAGAWDEQRRRLKLVMEDKPPMPPEPRTQAVHLPLWLCCLPDGTVYWDVPEPFMPVRLDARGKHRPMEPHEFAHRYVNEMGGACLILLWHPDVRPRLRTCEHCGKFWLLDRAKGKQRHFCDTQCRQAWERSPTGRSATAQRVREHRVRQPRGRRFLT